MKNVVLLSSSPKIGEQSSSEMIIKMVSKHINTETAQISFVNVRESFRKQTIQEDFETMSKADVIVIVFPLYVFCMPGILTRFLQDYSQFLKDKEKATDNVKIYTIVNCGFPEAEINLEAVKVIGSFSKHINANFRFGVLIGSGGMLMHAKDAFFMKKTFKKLDDAFKTIADDINNQDLKNIDHIYINMNFPRRLYFFMGDRGWKDMARKNGFKKEDLYRQPYQ